MVICKVMDLKLSSVLRKIFEICENNDLLPPS